MKPAKIIPNGACTVSDGQRRRVQLLLGLVRPFDILLLDEVTTCLDVIVRQDLMRWLQKKQKRGARPSSSDAHF